MLDSLSAVAAAHLVRNRRHAASGTSESLFRETVLMLSGSAAEIAAVKRVSLSGHEATIDMRAGLARHARHTDPAVPFESGGRTHLQVYLDRLPPDEAGDNAEVELDGGQLVRLPVTWADEREKGERISSRLVRNGPGRWALEIACREPIDMIRQETRDGRAVETVTPLPPGAHVVRIGPGFCETLGVALTTRDLVGGVEHKHMLFGKFGAGGGRHLADAGRIYAPKAREHFAYRSLVARMREDAPPGGLERCWEGFDEVEVFSPPALAEEAARAMRSCGVPWRIRTFGAGHGADIRIVAPGEEPQSGTYSYLLFGDAEDPDLAGKVAQAISAASAAPDRAALLDRAWLFGNEGPNDPATASVGVAFTTPSSVPLPRAAVAEVKRVTLAASPCRTCLHAARCEGALPYPRPAEAPPHGSACPLREAWQSGEEENA